MQSDIAVFLDTYLHFIVFIDESSNLYKFSLQLLTMIGGLLFELAALTGNMTQTPFQRLVGTREIQNMVQFFFSDSLKTMDIARIIHCFSSSKESSGSDRVSHLLSIKSYLNSINDSMTEKTHSGFISLLASLVTFEENLNHVQLSTLYFSESLTVLNSHKRFWGNKGFTHSAKQGTGLILKDCSLAIHILAHLSYFGSKNVQFLVQDEQSSVLMSIISAKQNRDLFPDRYLGKEADFDCLLLACTRFLTNLMYMEDLKGSATLQRIVAKYLTVCCSCVSFDFC